MTVLQWFLCVWGAYGLFAAIILDGKPREQPNFKGTVILVNLAIFQWLMWYAGAWN